MNSITLYNGTIFTGDRNKPWVEGLVIDQGKVVYSGGTSEALSYRSATKIDLKKKLVLPGFNDAHLHFVEGGKTLIGLNLREAENLEAFLERVREYAQGLDSGQWITSWGWDHENWPERRYPTRWDVDKVSANHPLLLFRLDGHVAVANSLALQIAGIARTTKIPGGEILLDSQTHEPNGVLRDKAAEFVARKIPRESLSYRKKAIIAALRYAARVGVTSLQEMETRTDDFEIYREFLEKGELSARIYVTPLFEDRNKFGEIPQNDILRVGGVKLFSDGSLGATSAWMFDPYDDEPDSTGLAIYSSDELQGLFEDAQRNNWQICIHAIGTRANHEVVKVFSSLLKNQPNILRHRIEHVQIIRNEDVREMARLGILASVQPVHYWDDQRWLVRRIGESRLPLAYRLGSFFRSKIPVAFGTDWPVEDLNPLLSLFSSVVRNNDLNTPDEGISLKTAIRAYTIGSAHAEFSENKKGRLVEGQFADLVVLSENIFKLPPEEFKNVGVDLTMVGGKIIFESQNEKFQKYLL